MATSLSALGHGFAQAGTAWVVGFGSEVLFDKIKVANDYPAVRVIGQFSVSMLILGELMRGLGGKYLTRSPIGDGMMMVWFYQPQKNLFSSVDFVAAKAAYEVSKL